MQSTPVLVNVLDNWQALQIQDCEERIREVCVHGSVHMERRTERQLTFTLPIVLPTYSKFLNIQLFCLSISKTGVHCISVYYTHKPICLFEEKK